MIYDIDLINKLKGYLLTFNESDIEEYSGYKKNGRFIHRHFFKEPVKLIFYWEESSFEGDICVLFKHQDKFILKTGSFGSCSKCDYWQGTDSLTHLNEKILMSFNDLKIYNDLSEIEFGDYTHPDLKRSFNEFKRDYFV